MILISDSDKQRIDKEKSIAVANANYNSKIAMITATVPLTEQISWPEQKAEANAWTLDKEASTPLLDGICFKRGVEKVDLVAKVLEKAGTYATYLGHALGERQAVEDSFK